MIDILVVHTKAHENSAKDIRAGGNQLTRSLTSTKHRTKQWATFCLDVEASTCLYLPVTACQYADER